MSGVNTASKHMKPGRRHRNRQAPQQRDQGGIVEIDMPIHVSNVALVHGGKTVRVGYSTDAKGNKVRVAKLGGGKTEVSDDRNDCERRGREERPQRPAGERKETHE